MWWQSCQMAASWCGLFSGHNLPFPKKNFNILFHCIHLEPMYLDTRWKRSTWEGLWIFFIKRVWTFYLKYNYIESIRNIKCLFSSTEMKRPTIFFVFNSRNYLSKHCMLGSTLSLLCTHMNPTNSQKITKKKKHPFSGVQTRLREAEQLAPGHKAIKWQIQDSRPGLVIIKSMPLNLYVTAPFPNPMALNIMNGPKWWISLNY